jgi:hypothetical protein
MPLLLELFSGTGSVGKAFRKQGWEVLSVDIDAKASPSLCCDVRDLKASDLPPIDCVWASPVCTQYSVARTRGGPRDLELADSLVLATLRLIEDLGSPPWFLENPYSGLLKSRPFMEGRPYQVVDYCCWGHPYRKRTAIWSNTSWRPSKALCRRDCAFSDGKRHFHTAQRGTHPHRSKESSFSLSKLYSIPTELCEEIASFASSNASFASSNASTISRP